MHIGQPVVFDTQHTSAYLCVQEEIKVFSSWTAALDTKYLYKTEQVAIAGYSSPLPLPSAFTGNAEGRGSTPSPLHLQEMQRGGGAGLL